MGKVGLKMMNLQPSLKDKIDIVMGVHNGGKYIQEQIDSIVEQTFTNWRLIIRDEASTDGTLDILRENKRKLGERLIFFHDEVKRGACQNFARALELSDADYAMFADSDDFWLPDKIWITYGKMKELESKYGKETPIYIFTDLKVADDKLRIINESFWKYQNLRPENGKVFAKIMTYNVTTGCTVMMNRRLRELVIPIPPEALMHDCWCAMVASCFGRIDYVNSGTILYRQHGNNDSGARRYNVKYVIKKTLEYLTDRQKEIFKKGEFEQAVAFLNRYGRILGEKDIQLIQDFISLRKKRLVMNKFMILKHRFFKPGLLRNIGLLLKA